MPGAGGSAGSLRVRKTESEAVAFVVSQAIALDAGTAAVDYIRVRDRIGGSARRFSGVSRRASGRPFDGWWVAVLFLFSDPARFSGLVHSTEKRVEARSAR